LELAGGAGSGTSRRRIVPSLLANGRAALCGVAQGTRRGGCLCCCCFVGWDGLAHGYFTPCFFVFVWRHLRAAGGGRGGRAGGGGVRVGELLLDAPEAAQVVLLWRHPRPGDGCSATGGATRRRRNSGSRRRHGRRTDARGLVGEEDCCLPLAVLRL
jgi:hypothetical protein